MATVQLVSNNINFFDFIPIVISSDGVNVAFVTTGNVGFGTNGGSQVYVKNLVTNTVTLVSHTTANASTLAISSGGNSVVFPDCQDVGTANPSLVKGWGD